MKNKVLFILLCSLFSYTGIYAHSGKMVSIVGNFNFDPGTKEVKLLNVEEGELETYATSKISDGQFGFMVTVKEPGFYYIDYGQMDRSRRDQLIRFYLEPGQAINVSINEKDYRLSGEDLGHNLLVQKANEVYNQFSKYVTLGTLITYEDFYPFIEDKGIKMYANLKKSFNTNDKKFNKLMALAAEADFEDFLYDFFRIPRTKFPKKDNPPAIYSQKYKKGIKFSNPDILKLGNGLEWMTNYFFYYGWIQEMEKGKDKTQKINRDIAHISNPKLKEIYIRKSIANSRFKAIEYRFAIKPLRQYLTSEKSKDFLVEYEKQFHKEEGQPGFNFTYKDTHDDPVSFSDFKGKLVYVDIWATWCGPCRQEIPYLKKLEEDLSGEDIAFISVSVDEPEDRQKWKDFVKDEKLGGVQLMADKAFNSGLPKNYDVHAIPRFLLFDKEGNIISTDAMRPSNSVLKGYLEELLEK